MHVFTALADPTRVRIVEILARQGSLPARAISEQFTISAPAISQHLNVLKSAHLVRVEAQAQKRIYSLNTESLHAIEGWANALQRLWSTRFDALDQLLAEEMKKLNNNEKGIPS